MATTKGEAGPDGGPATADPAEIEKFAKLAEDWWDPEGKFRPLHRLNPTRLAYLRDHLLAHFGGDAAQPQPLAAVLAAGQPGPAGGGAAEHGQQGGGRQQDGGQQDDVPRPPPQRRRMCAQPALARPSRPIPA